MDSSTMNETTPATNKPHQSEEEELVVNDEELEEITKSLEKVNFMGITNIHLVKFQDFWYTTSSHFFSGLLLFQRHFLARNTDLMVNSFPKTGTTWLKALLFSIVNRVKYPPKQSPLLTHNPHQLVFDVENIYAGFNPKLPRPHQLHQLPSPRLLHSHVAYHLLPESIKSCSTKIIYISRNPLDTLVSYWKYYPKLLKSSTGDETFEGPCIHDFFQDFCNGSVYCGPFFDHVLGYWKQSLEQPNKVLFLKYEDLKENPKFHLKKLAEFVGVPFSPMEENEGVIEDIIELCSFENLKELEVNKSGSVNKYCENKEFFREGKVGGWKNYLTPSMADTMKKLMEQKLAGTNLSFQLEP
ncbi:unnamed protein product [Amaranthus hypochondriacus]